MTPTPEEVLADCRLRLDSLLPERDAAVFLSNVGKKGGAWEQAFVEALAVAYKSTDALAASQERVRELEAENVALRANTSASVVRRLVEQGAIRGPELPAVWKAATLREIARKISEVTFSEKWEKHAAFLVQLADDFDAESPA